MIQGVFTERFQLHVPIHNRRQISCRRRVQYSSKASAPVRDRGNRQFSIACSQVCPPKIKRERSLTRCSFTSAVYGMVVPTVACHAIMAIALQSQFNSFMGFPQAWQRSVKQALHVKRKAISRIGLSSCLPGRPGQEFRHDGKARMDHAASRHKSLHCA